MKVKKRKIKKKPLAIVLLIIVCIAFLITKKEKYKENAFLNKGPSKFNMEVVKTNSIDLKYWLYTPKNSTKNMPLIIYLHGSNLVGNNLNMLLDDNSFTKYLKEGELGDVPSYIVIPQLPSKYENWKDINESLIEMINSIVKKYYINDKKISLTGFSLGGIASWDLAVLNPNLFSCIVPLAGSVEHTESNIKILSKIPIKAFVGTNDTVVNPNPTIKFIDELNNINTNATLIKLYGYKHSTVQRAYIDKEQNIINWMLSKSK